MKVCDRGKSWCLLPPMEGSELCPLHTELPVKRTFNLEGGLVSVESADDWKVRWRRHQDAKKKAAAKQAVSDAELAKRK